MVGDISMARSAMDHCPCAKNHHKLACATKNGNQQHRIQVNILWVGQASQCLKQSVGVAFALGLVFLIVLNSHSMHARCVTHCILVDE